MPYYLSEIYNFLASQHRHPLIAVLVGIKISFPLSFIISRVAQMHEMKNN